MSAYAFYFMGALILVFLFAFVGYYAYRLGTVRKQPDDGTERRLEQLIRSESVVTPPPGAVPLAGGEVGAVEGRSPLPTVAAPGSQRVYERGPGLRSYTEETVFMKRDRSGEVQFQLGDKPAMPLKFLLDAHARKVLGDLSMRTTVDFGQTWAILATEDEKGRLTVTRLF
ncbi:MAG: hypothetical protein ACYC5Q_02910 [Thermoleophilia bacterium]